MVSPRSNQTLIARTQFKPNAGEVQFGEAQRCLACIVDLVVVGLVVVVVVGVVAVGVVVVVLVVVVLLVVVVFVVGLVVVTTTRDFCCYCC